MSEQSQKQRIILVSVIESECLILKGKLEPAIRDLGPIQFVNSRPQDVQSVLDPLVSVVVLSTYSYNTDCRVAIADARRSGYKGPILIISKSDSAEALREMKALENVVLLEKPYDAKDLQGIIRKFILDRKVEQRLFRRYNTLQKAEIEVVSRKEKSVSTLLNLSRGGCLLEMPRNCVIKVGDLIRMTIELGEIRRMYELPAKVVWTAPPGKKSGPGGVGVGVEFVGRGSIISV